VKLAAIKNGNNQLAVTMVAQATTATSSHKGTTINRGDKTAAGTGTGKSCTGGHEQQQE